MGPPTDPVRPYRLYPSVRLCMFLLTLVVSTVLGGCFASFNFALVCMVNETAITSAAYLARAFTNATLEQCNLMPGSDWRGYAGEFAWDRGMQANLLAINGFGAFVANIPSGLLSDRYGSKLVFAACLLSNALASGLTPVAAYAGVGWMCVARLVQGLGYGASWPAMLAITSQWSTPEESATLFSLVAVGYQVGALIAMLSSSAICDSHYRWPLIFYIWSAICLIVTIVWLVLYTDKPKNSRFISEHELSFLQCHKMRKTENRQRFWRIPWRNILFSPSAIATHVSQFSSTWATYYIGEYMPTYSKEVLRFDVRSNGFTAALPALTQVIGRTSFGALADKFTFGGRSKTFSVKFFTSLGTIVPTICFVLLGFLDCRQTVLAVAAFSLVSAALATSSSGYGRGGVLMAPRYAGAVGAVSNSYGDVAALIMPYIVGAMAAHGTVREWQHTCWVTAAVMAVSFVAYQLFGTAEEQKWANETSPASGNVNKIYVVDGTERGVRSSDSVAVDESRL